MMIEHHLSIRPQIDELRQKKYFEAHCTCGWTARADEAHALLLRFATHDLDDPPTEARG